MGMAGGGNPFGQYQAGGQQLAAAGVNAQMQNKAALANSLPTFSADLKGAAVPNVQNMVSVPRSLVSRLTGTHPRSYTLSINPNSHTVHQTALTSQLAAWQPFLVRYETLRTRYGASRYLSDVTTPVTWSEICFSVECTDASLSVCPSVRAAPGAAAGASGNGWVSGCSRRYPS